MDYLCSNQIANNEYLKLKHCKLKTLKDDVECELVALKDCLMMASAEYMKYKNIKIKKEHE
jgi:hypothetical protein